MLRVFSFFLFFLALHSSGESAPTRVSRVAAVVNDHVISVTDVRNRALLAILSSGMESSEKVIQELSPQVLKTLIEEALQRQMAHKVGLSMDKGEVDYAISEIEQQNQMAPGHLVSMLEKKGIPAKTIRNQVKASTLWREYIRGRYGEFVQITEAQVDRKIKQLELSRDEPQLLLAEITLPFDSKENKSAVLKTAQNLAHKASRGARFSELARQFSSSSSAARGGDIGWVSEKSLDPEVCETVKKTQTGTLTSPICTRDGYTLIMVRDRRGAGESIDKDTFYTFRQLTFPLPRNPSEEQLYNIYTKAQSIAQNARSCSILDSLVGKRKGVNLQKISKASSRSMPFELKKLLDNLQPGKASKPLLTPAGAMLFMLCEKEEYNPETPSRENIRNHLKGEELSRIADRELRNLKSAAFIDIHL